MGIDNCIDCDKRKAELECNCVPVENADGTLQDVVMGCTDSLATNYNALANCDDGSCIDKVPGCMDPTSLNYSTCYNADCDGNLPGSAAYIEGGTYGVDTCCCSTAGCMDASASNYNSSACLDDGSCIYPGCIDNAACNYDPSATVDDGSCQYPTTASVTVSDCDPYTWALDGQTYYTSGTFTHVGTGSNGCDLTTTLNFTKLDSTSGINNQTICNSYTWASPLGDGNTYTTNGTHTHTSTNASGCDHVETLNLTIQPEGCTDPTAINYDPAAICDTGCIACTYGCMDATATNYDASATCDYGSCNYDVYGCMDPLACNYDPLATIDDNSCTAPPSLDLGSTNFGVNDANSLNQDASGASGFSMSYHMCAYPLPANCSGAGCHDMYGAHITKGIGGSFQLNGTGSHTGTCRTESYYFLLGTGTVGSSNPPLVPGQTYCITWNEIVLALRTNGQCSDCLMGGWDIRIDDDMSSPGNSDLNNATSLYDPVANTVAYGTSPGGLSVANSSYWNAVCQTNDVGNINGQNTAGASNGSYSPWNEKCITFQATNDKHRIHFIVMTDFNQCTACHHKPSSNKHGTYTGITNLRINTGCTGSCSC